jgi:hypothetical protein
LRDQLGRQIEIEVGNVHFLICRGAPPPRPVPRDRWSLGDAAASFCLVCRAVIGVLIMCEDRAGASAAMGTHEAEAPAGGRRAREEGGPPGRRRPAFDLPRPATRLCSVTTSTRDGARAPHRLRSSHRFHTVVTFHSRAPSHAPHPQSHVCDERQCSFGPHTALACLQSSFRIDQRI